MSTISIKQIRSWNRKAQLVVVVLLALGLKLYYSTASPNQLRWILAPTAALVELVTGTSFQFESYAGYLSSDRTFLIAASCAGVNFLITSFLMLSIGKLWRSNALNVAWSFIPVAALFAYMATLAANTVRISIALWVPRTPLGISWLSANQVHRLEGIFVYFAFLLLLFVVSERIDSESPTRLFRHSLFPLLIYYATTLGIPLANGAYRQGRDFWEHSLFVLLIPLPLIFILATLRVVKGSRQKHVEQNSPITTPGKAEKLSGGERVERSDALARA